ncbi:BACON domain-containing protein [Streptomyces sp. NBC_00310]|uniref:BACON domain-containing protein n=1 Tax=Streptomyces sp. NBC_00310 TaxID=2903645 RepID=UPI002E24001B
MMSIGPETSPRTTGAHRAHREARDRAAARAVAQRAPARYEPYLDGLFTYCMSVLCDHDAATAALAEVLALAERRRGPDDADDRRAWLYALARWACLRKLAEARQKQPGARASGRRSAHGGGAEKPRAAKTAVRTPALSEDEERQRRRQLALLAWPEAAGTTPEQREALELAVRHQLAAHEVADVLGMDQAAARELLAAAACEVERTRAALAVVESGACPSVARLTGDHLLVLSAPLRRELVRHVDDCPVCRRAAERAVPGRWPGTSVTPSELPVLEAPRAALGLVTAHLTRARGGAPRFDRRGFPMDPRDRAARRDRLRARAVTTTVVATVVAAPVFALWAAYRGAPLIGEGSDGRSVSAGEEQSDGDGTVGDGSGDAYENAGNARTEPGARLGRGKRAADDVSVEVTQGKGRGTLAVAAANDGDTTVITLRATGDSPVRWSARTGADWLYLSQSSGTLKPGESSTVKVYVDQLSEPAGYWTAQVSLAPSGAVVTIEGYGPMPTPPVDSPPTQPVPDPGPPRPTVPPPTPDPDPTPTGPAQPDPTPTPTDPAPTDPGGPTTPPGDGGGDPPPAS